MKGLDKVSNKNDIESQVVKQYESDHNAMILIFCQWCINNDLDPVVLYKEAYPEQGDNIALQQMVDITVSKEEAGEINTNTVIQVLSMFNNEDLAFIVSKYGNNKK